MNYKLNLEEIKYGVNLLGYIEKATSRKAKPVGNDTYRISPCPFCQGQDHFTINTHENLYKSFSECCRGGSIIDFLIEYEHKPKAEAIKAAKELAGAAPEGWARRPGQKEDPKRSYDFTQAAQDLHKQVDKTDYFRRRGLSITIEKFKLGYHPNGLNYVASKYGGSLAEKPSDLLKSYSYFIPCFNEKGECYYLVARRNDEIPVPSWYTGEPRKTHNLKNYPAAIFNSQYITAPDQAAKYIFITEGAFDALSAEECGHSAIALNSTSNASKFLDLVKKNKDLLTEKAFVVVGDNDAAGKELNKKLMKGLGSLKLRCTTFIISQYKDLNEWLVADRDGLKENIEKFIKEAELMKDDCAETKGSLIPFNFSDVGCSERLIYLYGDIIRYSFLRKRWYIWNGKRWGVDEAGSVEHMSRHMLRDLQQEAENLDDEENEKLKNQVLKFVLRSESDSRIKAMISQASSQPILAVREDLLDKDGFLLNCNNGTIDLRNGTLLPHTKENYLTKMAPIEYKPSMDCPNWRQFMDKIFMGDAEIIEYLQRTIGYSLTSNTDQQCFYMLYGSGANGKSTFLRVIQHIMGDYSAALKGSSLMVRRNDDFGARGDLAKLKGARFVWASELNDNQTFDESLIKSMTGGDPIAVRFLYGEEFELRPEFKLWIATNERPRIKGQNHGIWRRVRLIPFTYTIPESERNDSFFEEMLLPEMPGILNWAIEGCLSWRLDGIETPDSVKAAVEDYRSEMDVLQSFIDDCCITEKDKMAPTTQLYESYVKWCAAAGEREMTSTKFGIQMKSKGYKQQRKSYMRYWEGIGICSSKHGDPEQEGRVIPFK